MILAREFGWSLDDMRRLRPSELAAILAELGRQKTEEARADEARAMLEQFRFASMLAAIINAGRQVVGVFARRKPKLVKPDSLLGPDFMRRVRELLAESDRTDRDWSAHIEDAKAKGLKGPWATPSRPPTGGRSSNR